MKNSQCSLERTASWVIRDKTSGVVICETFDRRMADAINTSRYEAVPILEYLGSLGKSKED